MRRPLLLVLPLLLLAACGDDVGDGGEATGGNEVETTPLTFGDGSDVWLRVETGGGFVPMIFSLRQTPQLLLFDDGRLVRRTDDEVQTVPEFDEVQLDEAETADLLDTFATVVDGPDPGTPPITDNPSTTIEVTSDGETHSLSIYALGYTDGLSDSQTAAREAASDAIEGADAIDGAEPFVPDEWLALTVFSGREPATAYEWPLDADRAASPDTPNVCTRVTGDDVGTLLDELGQTAPLGSLVGGPNGAFEVALRPVLTGEEECNLSDADQFVER
jgi:hypothetical protein